MVFVIEKITQFNKPELENLFKAIDSSGIPFLPTLVFLASRCVDYKKTFC